MSLATYRKKRDFKKTAEPKGRARAKSGRSFVIQKHAASHLHYDFRLELDGVLKSWAVPKGPSLDPGVRALAIEVEDHPVEYGGFEGIIPAGEYGGGTVMVWDRGTWEPLGDDPAGDYKRGSLKFSLHGKKLKGEWALVRMKTENRRAQWLLIKHKDKTARPGDGTGITERKAKSVLTGRSMEQIAKQQKRVWTSSGERKVTAKKVKSPAKMKPAAKSKARVKRGSVSRKKMNEDEGAALRSLDGAVRSATPKSFAPQLATLAAEAPSGPDWLHELKFDGYRLLAIGDGKRVRLWTRNGNDWTAKFRRVAETLESWGLDGIIDGELVALDDDGESDFQRLQNALRNELQDRLIFYAFDLPYFAGYDLRQVPLELRKERLAAFIERHGDSDGPVRYSEHFDGDGPTFLATACKRGLEGIVCKRRDATYESRRMPSWLKVKCSGRQEFVIGGYTKPGGSRSGFGALLLGYFDDAGTLRYCGKVGTGFTATTLRDLKRKMDDLTTDECPFTAPPAEAKRGGPTWLEPKLVAEIEFTEWTDDGALRHPSYQGLREDKEAQDVVRESTVREKRRTKTAPKSGKTKPGTSGSKRATGDGEVAGVRISHPERVLYPKVNVTKLDLAEYYEAVADWILPYIVDRPLTLVRCPEGSSGQCFYQKNWKENLPDAIHSVLVSSAKENERYVTIDGLDGLISLVQMGVLEIHPWGSRNDRLEQPDQIIFDLDPGPSLGWASVRDSAVQLGDLLDELGLDTFVRTSGGKGLHVVVPLARKNDWDEVKQFAHNIATGLARHQPQRYVDKMTKSIRKGKIFVDYLRNQRGATSVASYSSRNRPTASVALPISWNELAKIKGPDQFTVLDVPTRLRRLKRDPWEGFFKTKQTLSAKVIRSASDFAR